MDDRKRLLRLISFVAWAGEPGSNQCGLRFARDDDEQQWHGPGRAWAAAAERGESASRPEETRFHAALWRLTSWYTGAVWSGNDPASRDLDTQQLPGITLEALEGLPDDVLAMLGRMVRSSLGLGTDIDELGVARRWADDVRATAWRLLVAEHEDRFGRP